jgi:cysteine desulfurase
VLRDLEPAAADLHGATWTAPATYELRPDAARFELWEHDVAARLGLKEAVDLVLELGVEDVEKAVRSRAADLRNALSDVPGVTVRDVGPDLAGIVSFTVDGVDAERVAVGLGQQDVTVKVSTESTTLLDMNARGLRAVVRASPHYFVSPEDIARTAAAVARLRP